MTETTRRRWALRFALVSLLIVAAAIGQREQVGWVLPYLLAVAQANPIIMAALVLLAFAVIPFNFQEAQS